MLGADHTSPAILRPARGVHAVTTTSYLGRHASDALLPPGRRPTLAPRPAAYGLWPRQALNEPSEAAYVQRVYELQLRGS